MKVVLAVQDEGCGIPADELDGIFQPFRSSFERGTGLGLAIVHRIVTDYNGAIQVSSDVGAGTTVQRAPAGACRHHGAAAESERPEREPYDAAIDQRPAARADDATNAEAAPSRAFSSSTTSRRCARCCASCCAATATT